MVVSAAGSGSKDISLVMKTRAEVEYIANVSGAISLQEAQREIATNWLSVYDKMPKDR